LFAAAWTVAALPAFAAELEPAAALAEIRSTKPDLSAAVSLRQVEIELGPAMFEVERGILVPAKSRSGRILELIFVGQARVRLDAPDDIEASQLELFTGERSLEAPVEEAVLVMSNTAAIEALTTRSAPREIRPELVHRVERLHERWLEGAERRRAGVESSMFKALVGDSVFQHYFAVWCRSFELGDFVIQLDPEDVEPITVASFEPLEVVGWDRMRLRHQIRVQQRKDRWLTVRLETRHYELDVKLKKDKAWLDGKAKLDLEVQTSGRRVVRLELYGDLTVSRIADGDGRELFFFRSGNEVVVHLPEPSRAGERMVLEVAYDGRALHWVRSGLFDLEETDGWYPHCGTVDRATYDVTLRWPKRRELLAGGRIVASGRERDYRWERRALDVPSIAFSFMLGEFDVETTRVGHVDVALAFALDSKVDTSPELRAHALETVADALAYFERAFGPYPLDELTLVTVPRRYSQSYLGFITLAESMIRQTDPLSPSSKWQRSTTIAHELAHQWWGNLIGWWSYRDQWLSEGMANYSALLYDGYQSNEGSNRLALMSAGWRDSLSLTTLDGRTIESLGPIVLGNRLNSSRANNAYRAIVYRKGAVVLAMLARAVGEERFIPMLRSLVEAASGRVMTTENFLKSVERMSGLDLEGFAQQFVYGTGIPEVYYAYDTAPTSDGGWVVEGEARLMAAPRYGYRVVRTAGGHWDVERTPGPRPGARPTTLVVPYRVTLDQQAEADRRKQVHLGQMFLQGRRDSFRIETDLEPIDLRLDPRGEILAWFYSEQRHPKRVLRYEAEDLAIDGRWEEAEARYEDALRVPSDTRSMVDPLGPPLTVPQIDGRLEDLKIRLSIVRLHIDREDLDSATAELDAIDASLDDDDRELLRMGRDALRARVDIHRGKFGAAHRRLKKTLRIASPSRDHHSWRELLLQMQLNSERVAVAESFTLLAVASYELDRELDLEWALREARDRGADVSLLVDEEG